METKQTPIMDLMIEDERVVKAVYAVLGNVDAVGDRIASGAFDKTISEAFPAGRVKALWQHDATQPPIGAVMDLKIIPRGDLPLKVRDAFPDAKAGLYGPTRYLDTPRGNEVLQGIKGGAITENSIGYDSIKSDMSLSDDGSPIRELKELRLWDVSPVNWGANPATANLKAANPLPDNIETLCAQIDADLKAGRVLSSANIDRLKAAIDALQQVMLAAEPPEETPKALTVHQFHALQRRLALAGIPTTVHL